MERRVLVTGFERFGHHEVNPSARAARELEQRFSGEDPSGVRVCSLVLPVTYAGAAHVLRERVRVERPAGVLLLGLAANERELRVERLAFNETERGRADNMGGDRAGAPLEAHGERVRAGDEGAVRAVYGALEGAGAAVRYSDDAGRYVCNSTYYAALAGEGHRAVFVHVPPTTCSGGALDDELLAEWLAAAVRALGAPER